MSTHSNHPLVELIKWFSDLISYLTYDKVLDLFYNAPQYYIIWWKKLFYDTPEHVIIETTLVIFILWLVFIRRTIDPKKKSEGPKLTEKEINWLIETWTPEPLVPQITKKHKKINEMTPIIERVDGLMLEIRGLSKPVINLNSFDFLGLGNFPDVKEIAVQALDKYGCGSCGPRGFYGTIDQHILFENAIAKFMGTTDAIAYSDGSSAVSSCIPAFAKRGDLLIVDEACSEPIINGVHLSRSTVQYFKHNDMNDLAKVLQSIANEDKRLNFDTLQQRRFIVVEGIYRNTGEICKLKEIVDLKKKYFYRVILDESISFGTLGRTGRGLTEHYNVPVSEIDMLILAMDTTLASVGGVCVGERDIVEHQRLSGAGYCFSASAPPFLSATATKSLSILEKNPDLIKTLHGKSQLLAKGLSQIKGLKLITDTSSYPKPIIHFTFDPIPNNRELEEEMLLYFVNECVTNGVGISVNKFALSMNKTKLRPSIRVCISALLTDDQINYTLTTIENALSTLKLNYKL